jgi:hypothetical protein
MDFFYFCVRGKKRKETSLKDFGPEPGDGYAGKLRQPDLGPSLQEALLLLLGLLANFTSPPFFTRAEAHRLGHPRGPAKN